RGKPCADFVLACRAYLVVMDFDRYALLFKKNAHFRTHVVESIDRRHGNIASLSCRAVPLVAPVKRQSTRPWRVFAHNIDKTAGRAGIPADSVKHVEFGLGAKISGIAQPC